jgi:hypothetical protein
MNHIHINPECTSSYSYDIYFITFIQNILHHIHTQFSSSRHIHTQHHIHILEQVNIYIDQAKPVTILQVNMPYILSLQCNPLLWPEPIFFRQTQIMSTDMEHGSSSLVWEWNLTMPVPSISMLL